VTRYIEGFSHFVTSIAAPIASGWSKSCRVGLSPTGKRRLSMAHAQKRYSSLIILNENGYSVSLGALPARWAGNDPL
jgi:hypothetical protein